MTRRRAPPVAALVVGLVAIAALIVVRFYVYIPLLGDDTKAIHDPASLPHSLHVCGRTWHKDALDRQQKAAELVALSDGPPQLVDPRQFAPCPAGACGATAGGPCATVIFERVGEDAFLS